MASRHSPLQVAALGVGARQVVGPPVGLGRLRSAAEAAQHVPARRREQVVLAQFPVRCDPLQQGQPGLGSLGQGDGNGSVQLDHGRGRHVEEAVVEHGDLGPVRRAVTPDVAGGDGRLDLEGPGTVEACRRLEQLPTLGDGRGIPQRAVLLRQDDELAVRVDPRRAAGVVEEHEGEHAQRLGLVRHEAAQDPTQADGLGGQVAPNQVGPRGGRIPLVEEEVEHRQHRGRPFHQPMGRRHGERNAGMADLPFGPHEPLGHRCLGHEEGPGDLRRRHARQRAQGERHLCLERERRVATREHEAEAVVGYVPLPRQLRRARVHERYLPFLGRAHAGPARPIDGAVAGHRREPRSGAARYAVAGPALQRGGEGILRALLGEIPVAGQPDQGRNDPAPLGVERIGDGRLDLGRHISQIGLTSTEPSLAPGIRAATSIASSRSLQSTRK